MAASLEKEVLQLHSEICAGLADPSRILILYALADGPCAVGELVKRLSLSQPQVSRHLKVLRDRSMVRTERHGTGVIYTLGDRRLIEALDLLRAVMRTALARRAILLKKTR